MNTSPVIASPPRPAVDLGFAADAITRLGRTPDMVIPVLQALQDHYGFLPREALEFVCRETAITPASITGVATFYDMFRHEPVGKHVVHVCHGTACHVAGAERVEDALRRHLGIPAGANTDPNRQFTIEPVACLGCCTLAPVVRIAEDTIGYASAEKLPGAIREILVGQASRHTTRPMVSMPPRENAPQIQVCLDSCCVAKGTDHVFRAIQETVERTGANATVKRVGCVGACYRTPMIEVLQPDGRKDTFTGMTPALAGSFVEQQFPARGLAGRISGLWTRVVDGLLLPGGEASTPVAPTGPPPPDPGAQAFFRRQVHIAMEHYGRLDPLNLDECLAHGGFASLARCLGIAAPVPGSGGSNTSVPLTPALSPGERGNPAPLSGQPGASDTNPARRAVFPLPGGEGQGEGHRDAASPGVSAPAASPLSPDAIITCLEQSGLRGRGGAGFPTGQKWRMVRKFEADTKYVICNGDEGDPGAFMDRMILESFPYRVIEGLSIAAVAF